MKLKNILACQKYTMYLQNLIKFTKIGKIPHTKELTGMELTKILLIKHFYCYQTP